MPDAAISQPLRPLVSIVIPVLNEQDNIQRLYDLLCTTVQQREDRYSFEFIFTDNHSSDRTFLLVHQLARQDRRIRLFRFSRNVGFQKSILTGYLQARGECVIQIDADMQDPPEMILQFIDMWGQGYHVVYGIRRQRREAWLIRQARAAFYWLVDKLSEDRLPRQAGDFRLVARPVIEAIRHMDNAFPYLRGTIAGLGFNQTGIPYDRDERRGGASKFSFATLFALAVDGILATSIVPLRLAVYMGLLASIAALAGGFYYFVSFFVRGRGWPSGFATLAVLLTLSLALNSLFLGIIGEYVGRLYIQSRRRPLSLLEYSVEDGRLRNHAAPPYTGAEDVNQVSFDR